MQIFSVNEHINSLNSKIGKLIEFVDDVKRMRYLQGSGGWGRQVSEIKAAEKKVDDFFLSVKKRQLMKYSRA